MTHNKALTTWLTTKTRIASVKKHRKDRLNQTSENFEKINQKFFEQHKFFDDFKANNGKKKNFPLKNDFFIVNFGNRRFKRLQDRHKNVFGGFGVAAGRVVEGKTPVCEKGVNYLKFCGGFEGVEGGRG